MKRFVGSIPKSCIEGYLPVRRVTLRAGTRRKATLPPGKQALEMHLEYRMCNDVHVVKLVRLVSTREGRSRNMSLSR